MMQNTKTLLFPMVLFTAAALACGSAQEARGLGEQVEPGAVQTTTDHEIPGFHDEADLDPLTAERWIDNVALGRTVDGNGKVPAAARSDSFVPGEEIFLSMEVTDAPGGTAIRVDVLDSRSDRSVWTAESAVPVGRSHMHFALNDMNLEAGQYLAEVRVGDETVARKRFKVIAPSA